MQIRFFVTVLFCGLIAWTSGAEVATSAPTPLNQCAAALQEAATAQCRFTELGTDASVSEWAFSWAKPNRFRIETKGPNAWCCVSDGERMHHPDLPVKQPPTDFVLLGALEGPWPVAMLTQFFSEEPFESWSERAERVENSKTEKGLDKISMTALMGDPEAKIEITFGQDHLPLELVVATSESGILRTRTLKFSDWKLDKPIADSEFDPYSAPETSQKQVSVPDLSLDTLEGDKLALRSDGRKRVLVLDFFASWCKPCGESLKRFQDMAKRFTHANVQFVAVNIREGSDKIRSFLLRNQVDPEVALDEEGKLAKALQVNAFPTTVLVGSDGRVLLKKEGLDEAGNAAIEHELNTLLEDAPADSPKKNGAIR